MTNQQSCESTAVTNLIDMSCQQDCRCYLCRELAGFRPSNSYKTPSGSDNFILVRPNADRVAGRKEMKLQPISRSKEVKHSDRSFAMRIPDIKMSIIGYWKNKDAGNKKDVRECRNSLHKPPWETEDKIQVKVPGEIARKPVEVTRKTSEALWNINGQNVRIDSSKPPDDVMVEGWVTETKEDTLEVKNTERGSLVVVVKGEQNGQCGEEKKTSDGYANFKYINIYKIIDWHNVKCFLLDGIYHLTVSVPKPHVCTILFFYIKAFSSSSSFKQVIVLKGLLRSTQNFFSISS